MAAKAVMPFRLRNAQKPVHFDFNTRHSIERYWNILVVLMSFKNVARFSMGIILCLSANEVAFAQSATQTQFDRTVEQYTCKDIVREAGSSRDVAVAFLHGYLLGKSGSSKFNIDTLQKQTDAFLERCLDNPKDKAEDVMMQIKK